MKKKIAGYKVRNIKTGLYMRNVYTWTKVGKIWCRRADIFKTINIGLLNASYSKRQEITESAISEWEIVELAESGTSSFLFDISKIVGS